MARSMLLALTMVAALAAMAPAATTPAPDRIYVSSEDLESEESLRGLYERWYALYRREGDPGDKEKRFATFKKEARTVHELNEGGAAVKHHLNSFADLTHEEYADSFANCSPLLDDKYHAAARGGGNRHQPSKYYPDNLRLTVDWRTIDGVLTGVKYQGRCGCCWAFAATGAMESVHFIENKVRTTLSVQELVDCSTANLGCKGGWASKAFQHVIDNKGIDSWKQYPYLGEQSFCTTPLNHPVMAIRSFYFVDKRDENLLMDAVTQQPVVVLIVGANTTEFKHYAGGVFRGPCDTESRHEALLVGYGTTPDNDPKDPGVNYWVVKNSWGEAWGELGYMRLHRGFEADGGVCGIMLDPVYPANAYST